MKKILEEPSVIFIGGLGVGKTSLIENLWPQALKCNVINDIIDYSVFDGVTESINSVDDANTLTRYHVSENIPGRGIMEYHVVEMPSILYSLQEQWLENNCIIEEVTSADTIVIVMPSSSFGYKQEVSFIKTLIANKLLSHQHLVICLNKADHQFLDAESGSLVLDGVTRMLHLQSSLFIQIKNCLSDELFDADSVVFLSAPIEWNFDKMREKVWEGIIARQNDRCFNDKIPTVVIAGKRGSGKSSTLNELWGLNLPTNKAVACTKYPMVIPIEGEWMGKEYKFNLVDLPGIAESLDADMQYTSYYEKYIKRASLLICLSQADTRAYKQDELFYTNLIAQGILTKDTNIILGINQIDLLFKTETNPDGIDLDTISQDDTLIKDKISDYYDKVYGNIFNDFPNVTIDNVCVLSALKRWNLNNLLSSIINNLKN
jgi:hypothetical protein